MEITLNNVVKCYREKTVLNIPAFRFDKGKIYGIIGPNGAGKTTLLKVIARLEELSEGEILYDRQPFRKAVLKEMTYLTQKPFLFSASVAENISYPLKFRKYPKEKIRTLVEKIISEFGIGHLAKQLATKLSGGEAQRVALARALVFEPQILLLDEPTSNMDPNSIEMIEKIILKYNQNRDKTILFITHNVGQAKRVCDEVIYLENGVIVESGGAMEVIENPKTDSLRRFLSLEYYVK